MKKIIMLLFIVWLLVPMPYPWLGGSYNPISGLIWCTPGWCEHEVGHKLDDLSGWISSTDEYKEAIGPSYWNEKETYAEVFAFYGGKEENMPAHLAIFYNWELADKLMEKYNG